MKRRRKTRLRDALGRAVALAVFVVAPPAAAQIHEGHIVPQAIDGVSLVVNVPQRMLFRFDGSLVVDAHPVAVGRRAWPTPLGDFTVVVKEANPTWDVPRSIQEEMRREGKPVVTQVPPGPNNPLGRYWLGLSLHNIGIHGTSVPSSISRAVTHGCIRLRETDIESVYLHVPVGTRGRIIYQSTLLAMTSDGVFLEAHPDVYRREAEPAVEIVRRRAVGLGVAGRLDWSVVERVLVARTGVPTRVDPADSSHLPGNEGASAVRGGRDE